MMPFSSSFPSTVDEWIVTVVLVWAAVPLCGLIWIFLVRYWKHLLVLVLGFAAFVGLFAVWQWARLFGVNLDG